ncbi:MAG: IS110 family transposase [Planctomycetota bacterium]
MQKIAQFVGLDVHKDSIALAVAPAGPGLEVRDLGQMPHDVPRIVKRILSLGEAGSVHVAYEAGPTGYGLCRALKAEGIPCIVVAPSKTPQVSGDRVKTDRRDAAKLARFLRSGDLVPVTPPEKDVEALRDVLRAREDVVFAQRRARQQLSGFLLRHDRKWSEKSAWTQKHMEWIRSQRFESEAQQQVLEDYAQEVQRQSQRLLEASEHVEALAPKTKSCATLYTWLQSMRGVGPITAATIVAEIGDLRRFGTASQLMSYVGLVPSERSSGPTVRRGSITKAGNPHVRWKLIESAWHARHRPAFTTALRRRSDGVPQAIQDIAWKAQKRLHKRYWSMLNRGKRTQTTVVAIARELCGFIWAIGQEVPQSAA